MEYTHKEQLRAKFPQQLRQRVVVVLDIPDEYGFMDPELVEIFEDLVPRYL